MTNFYVNKSYTYLAWLLGLLCMISGLAVSIHFKIFSPVIIPGLLAFLFVFSWKKPLISISDDFFKYQRFPGKVVTINRADMVYVNEMDNILIIKTNKKKYLISLLLIKFYKRDDVLNLLKKK